MKPSIGEIEIDGERYLIKKATLGKGLMSSWDILTLYCQKHKSKEKKEVTIRSYDLIDDIISDYQKKFPNSIIWKTLSQRMKHSREGKYKLS